MKANIKAVVHWRKWEWENEPVYIINPSDLSRVDPCYVPVREIEIEVEIPDDFDPRPQQIEALRKEKQRILAEAEVKATNIEEQIQRLLCIEYKPELV